MTKPTDTSEAGLEAAIVKSLLEEAGYQQGNPDDYDRAHAIDLTKLAAFLRATQPTIADSVKIEEECPTKTEFLARLKSEIGNRGVVDVLRKGIKHHGDSIRLFYGSPSSENADAQAEFEQNIFSVTRQLHYSPNTQQSLDMGVFINGLPVATFELKNKLTKQTVSDAVEQYKSDRNPRETLFEFGRCLVHFAVDDHEVRMCTELKGKSSSFLPFNKGRDDGAGNPPNPEGLATDYLWKDILAKARLTDIIENYAQVIKRDDGSRVQIFPRYHQLTVVQELLADIREKSVGELYLIQHSAGSGKSNSIAWLAYQLAGLEADNRVVYDSIIVITDRKVLDRQIRDTIKSFAQVSSVVGYAENSGDLRRFISEGKRIIITTVQKFPFILNDIGSDHKDNTFAIIIDEAHSSQGGRMSSKMNAALAGEGAETAEEESEEDTEDVVNALIGQRMEQRKMLKNASYFAFTATPKPKTLEIFGKPAPNPDGTIGHKPFHSYTMKQAIEEDFILDVLRYYTTVKSYYHLIKKVADNPIFDAKKAKKKLRRYVETNKYAIRQKAEIMVDHFCSDVMGQKKIGGKARALVAAGGIKNAVEYYHAIRTYLEEKNLPYGAIIAFSGEYDYGGKKVTEADLNDFPSSQITQKIRENPYRFLVVAEKFLTGYDEPLMHTMYVDKRLSDIKAVQTLSRLNRAHPQKHDVFVLDFYNDTDEIKEAFSDYYGTTLLSEETDPNRLHNLKAALENHQVFSPEKVNEFVRLYLMGRSRDKLDPILDVCVAEYIANLGEDAQVDFKSKAKEFARTYNFLSCILPYSLAEWEKLSIFLDFLVPKLPAPKEEDLSKGILETIDMDSYRVEKQAAKSIDLVDEDGVVDPASGEGVHDKQTPEIKPLDEILDEFNDLFGHIDWKDGDKEAIKEIPQRVAADIIYQNAIQNSDEENARAAYESALKNIMVDLYTAHPDLYKRFSDDSEFKKWLSDAIFHFTYHGIKNRSFGSGNQF